MGINKLSYPWNSNLRKFLTSYDTSYVMNTRNVPVYTKTRIIDNGKTILLSPCLKLSQTCVFFILMNECTSGKSPNFSM